MRVLVNTRLLIKNKLEGIGWFTFETFKRITQNNPNVEFIFLFDRPFHQDFVFGENVIPVKKVYHQGIQFCGICGLKKQLIQLLINTNPMFLFRLMDT